MRHYILAIFSIFLCITSCTSELAEESVNTDGMHTYRMLLDGGFGSYRDEPSSRGTMTLADGTKLYLNLDGKTGTAIYHKNLNEWSLTYTGSLSGSGKCAAYYISDGAEDNESIILTPSSAVYGTNSGTYTCTSDGSITVKATLSPACSRFRLKGASGTQVQVSGVKVASSFSLTSLSFSQKIPEILSATIDTNGCSQYLYFCGNQPETLSLTYGNKVFTIKNPLKDNNMSVYFDLPTEANHKGWTMKDKPVDPVAVDLGLSVKWATFNVGADAPEDYGDYYAWGETEPKDVYYLTTYKWCNGSYNTLTKYCAGSEYGVVDNKTVLDLEDDVAHVKWGGSWRMPTVEEINELRDCCAWIWTTQNGMKGYKVTSNTNGNSIFLPAAGYRSGSYIYSADEFGNYWSSSLYPHYFDDAYVLYFNSGNWSQNRNGRQQGIPVRAVCL